LIFLVVGFPAQSQLETSCLAVQGLVDEPFHRLLLHVPLQGECGLYGQQAGNSAQRHGLGEEGSLPGREQKHGTPTANWSD
jgi:hypothetical protein